MKPRTNKYNLPKSICRAIDNKHYSGTGEERDFSATELLKPTKQIILFKRHENDVQKDYIDDYWTLQGEAMHNILEKANTGVEGAISEERLKMNVDGYVISGGMDLVEIDSEEHTIKITDYKYTSVYTYLLRNPKKVFDWTMQLNIYKMLVEKNKGLKIDKLAIVIMARDWKPSKFKYDTSYPCPCIEMDIEILSDETILSYIRSKISQIEFNKIIPDDQIILCTPDERWDVPSTFAVMKKGRKSAMRVLPTLKEAEDWITAHSEFGLYIEERKGASVRCSDWCDVKDWCNYYKKEVLPNGITNGND